MVDLGGSLAVASRGLFATGVSTDLNVTYLSSGGKIGDLIKAEVTCDKCTHLLSLRSFNSLCTLSLSKHTHHIYSLLNSSLTLGAVGKTLAFTSIAFSNSKGDIFARGSHTKYVALAWKDPNNIVEELLPKQSGSEKKE
jgi:acyl-coenzyme A thioesterase 13